MTKSRDRTGIIAAVLLSAVLPAALALSVDRLDEDHPRFDVGDHLVYIPMAESPGGPHPAPYCYRKLVPTLAWLLPIGTQSSFYLLTLLFLWGTGVVLYLVLRELGEDRFYALAGVALFYSLNWGAKFLLYDFWLVDPALFFAGTLAVYAALRGNSMGTAAAIALGVTAKETAVFLLPLCYGIWAKRFVDLRAVRRILIVAIVPIAVFVLLHVFVPATGSFDIVAFFRAHGLPQLRESPLMRIRGATLGTWGVLVLGLAFFGGLERRDYARATLLFLIFVYLQPLVDRVLVFGFLGVIPLATSGLRRLSTRFQLAPWMRVGYVAVPFVLLLTKGASYHPASPEQRLLGLFLWSVVVFFALRRRHPRISPLPPS